MSNKGLVLNKLLNDEDWISLRFDDPYISYTFSLLYGKDHDDAEVIDILLQALMGLAKERRNIMTNVLKKELEPGPHYTRLHPGDL